MRPSIRCLLACLPIVLARTPAHAQDGQGKPEPAAAEGWAPVVEPASDEARTWMGRIEIPDGFELSLFAAEPLLANPVCFAIDVSGRFFVAETFRHYEGVTDIRDHMDWLDEDLASRTVEDRVAMIRRHEGEDLEGYVEAFERVRLIEDRDGDGVADTATVFADDFRHPAAGIGAGLLTRGDDVYFACIPDMWRLRDTDGDGQADEREVLHTGYGVNVALLGHDLHGLRQGPDGRLYFSIGDRGFHVETEGRTLAHPHAGAVLRCNLDGSGLEIFATGLRNPQELVFDERGDLFTGDNNSDGGDKARWVWVLEGSDSGWRYSYQWITEPNLRGPWNAEKLWWPWWEGQAAYILPPIENVAAGPSGLTYYPGSGWNEDWRGRFFLCDFRGNPAYSGVHSFRVQAKGAGFEVVDQERFLWGSLVTDVEFDLAGNLYVSDWVEGWNKTGKGRIFRVRPEAEAPSVRGWRSAELLGAGLADESEASLAELLRHDDQRVRLEAQFALVERGATDVLLAAAERSHFGLARLHGIWGLAQCVREGRAGLDALEPLLALCADAEPEVRAQSARALGEAGAPAALDPLVGLLADREPRVRLFAALALGKLGSAQAAPALLELARRDSETDPWLRHGVVAALDWIGDEGSVARAAADDDVAVRRTALLVWRRQENPAAARMLTDPDASLVAEAARAIYDVPIPAAMGVLADRIEGDEGEDRYLSRRILNANRALGGERRAAAIATWLARGAGDATTRTEALEILAEWNAPGPRDRVTGAWRPCEERGAENLPELAALLAPSVSARGDANELAAWIELVGACGATDLAPVLVAGAEGRGWGAATRRAALDVLVTNELPGWRRAVRSALSDPDSRVAGRACEALARLDVDEALPLIEDVLEAGPVHVQQGAVRALAGLPPGAADRQLESALGELAQGTERSAIGLELLEAASGRDDAGVQRALAGYGARAVADESLAAYEVCLEGGDAASGADVFTNKTELTCLRCHKLGEQGTSEIGPDLTGIGERLSRRELLASIVDPNRDIALEYESWMLVLDDDTLLVGRILEEGPDGLVLLTREDEEFELAPEEIVFRRRDVSAMPEGLADLMTRRELRDLVEFLAGSK